MAYGLLYVSMLSQKRWIITAASARAALPFGSKTFPALPVTRMVWLRTAEAALTVTLEPF